jgi:hypothetical protein
MGCNSLSAPGSLMTLAIRCPHCDKSYNLKDELKGKRVACTNPNCKKVFTVQPAAAPATAAQTAAAPAKPAGKPATVEELALAALAEDGKAAEPKAAPPEGAPIRVKCQFCDHESVYDAKMAGKNAPCRNDECRKIIKVPLPKKEDPKDWRNVGKRPTAAKVDVPELEGAWGNVQTTAVSREALVGAEADRVEEEREPRSWAQIIKIGLIAGAIVLLLITGTLFMLNRRSRGKQDRAMEQAIAYLDPKSGVKLKKDQAALIQMFAGEYELAREKPGDAKNRFIAARGGIDQPATAERSAALIELACRQAALAGSAEQTAKGVRLDWDKDKVSKEVVSTLQKLPSGGGEEFRDLRSYALRRLTRVLAAQGNVAAAETLGKSIGPNEEHGEALAVIGLELLAMGRRDDAERIAKNASNIQGSNSESLIALWLALGAPDAPAEKRKQALEKARAVAAPAGENVPLTVVNRTGYAEGWARQGDLAKGRELAWKTGKPEERLRAGAAVAAAVVQTRKGETADLEQCAKLVETELRGRAESKWLLFRLALLSLQAGNRELAGRFAKAITDDGLKTWAHYEIFRDTLAGGGEASVEAANAIGGEERLARWLAVVEVMRRKADAAGKGIASGEVNGWPDGPARPFGYAGVALSEK